MIKGNKKEKSEMNYLDKVPKHNEKLQWKQDSNNNITIFVRNKGFFNCIGQNLFGKPKITQIHLDKMGNFIWPLIDGNNSVYDIAISVKKYYGDDAEPLYDRLIKYLQILKNQGLIKV